MGHAMEGSGLGHVITMSVGEANGSPPRGFEPRSPDPKSGVLTASLGGENLGRANCADVCATLLSDCSGLAGTVL